MLTKTERKKNYPKPTNPSTTIGPETVSWINIIMARINSTHVDSNFIKNICETGSKIINTLPNKPSFLVNATISPLKPADSAPFIQDLTIIPSEDQKSTSLSFILHFRGSSSLLISTTSSAGILDMKNLFSFSLNIEVALKLLLAPITITFGNDTNDVAIKIGEELLVEFDIRPLLGDTQNASQNHLVSVSNWINDLILEKLKGMSYSIPNN